MHQPSNFLALNSFNVERSISDLIEGLPPEHAVHILENLLTRATIKKNDLLAAIYTGPVSVEQMTEAILSAFPSLEMLDKVFRYSFNIRINQFLPNYLCYADQARLVATWGLISYEGGPLKFIISLLEEKRGNTKLNEVYDAFRNADQA